MIETGISLLSPLSGQNFGMLFGHADDIIGIGGEQNPSLGNTP